MRRGGSPETSEEIPTTSNALEDTTDPFRTHRNRRAARPARRITRTMAQLRRGENADNTTNPMTDETTHPTTDGSTIEHHIETVESIIQDDQVTLTLPGGEHNVTFAAEIGLAKYAGGDGIVGTDGLRDVIDDWRSGEIGTDLLRDVIDA